MSYSAIRAQARRDHVQQHRVGILHNGAGSVLALRTVMHALPIEEKTGLPYASAATTLGADGTGLPRLWARCDDGSEHRGDPIPGR